MRLLDVTTTATLRPEILNHTLETFCARLLRHDNGVTYRHIINVDPIGDENRTPGEVVEVARRYFRWQLIRVPEVPSFPTALAWCWKTSETEFIFNLEDDFEMRRDVDLNAMIDMMVAEPDLAILRLNFFESRIDTCRQWNRHIPWNGRYFEIPQEKKEQLGYSGHPSLIRRAFIEKALTFLRPGWCPEKSLKGRGGKNVAEFLASWRYGVWQEPKSQRYIADIGRKWREAKGLYKHRGGAFTTWEHMQPGETEDEYRMRVHPQTP